MNNLGFLAIWTEVDEETLVEYRQWLTREHIGQRIFAPGFLGARVHVRPDNERAHFILYATGGRDVLQSASYLNVLNTPTTWTQKMMPRLKKFDRGAGEQIEKCGDGTGGWLVVSRLAATPRDKSAGEIREILEQALEIEGVVTARLFSVDQESTSVSTTEKRMRSGVEGAFQQLLVVEACSDLAAMAIETNVSTLIAPLLDQPVVYDVARYRLVYALYPFEGATAVTE